MGISQGGQARPSGTGGMSAGASTPQRFGATAMAGAGAFVPSVTAIDITSAGFAGAGTFVEGAVAIDVTSAAFSGAGAFTNAAAVPSATVWSGQATFSGSGS